MLSQQQHNGLWTSVWLTNNPQASNRARLTPDNPIVPFKADGKEFQFSFIEYTARYKLSLRLPNKLWNYKANVMAQFKCEVVVFIAVICAARAAVTVNIYEDGKFRFRNKALQKNTGFRVKLIFQY